MSAYRFVAGTAVFFVAISVIVITGVLGNQQHDQEAIEAFNQYCESDIAAFYLRLESVNKISIQLTSTTLTPEMRLDLTSQRDLLESEMRQEVNKIPVGSRTSAMIPYTTNN